jgi:hypothetical protein
MNQTLSVSPNALLRPSVRFRRGFEAAIAAAEARTKLGRPQDLGVISKANSELLREGSGPHAEHCTSWRVEGLKSGVTRHKMIVARLLVIPLTPVEMIQRPKFSGGSHKYDRPCLYYHHVN